MPPGVADVSQAENILNNRDRMVQWNRPIDYVLRELVENKDDGEPACDEFGFAAQAEAPAFRTPAHRAQTSGYVGSRPTSSSYFQQRAHLPPSALNTETKLFKSSASKELTRLSSGKSTITLAPRSTGIDCRP